VARAMLTLLLDGARTQGFAYAQLESLTLMTQAHCLYRSLGFVDVMPFEHSETEMAGLVGVTRYMGLALRAS